MMALEDEGAWDVATTSATATAAATAAAPAPAPEVAPAEGLVLPEEAEEQ